MELQFKSQRLKIIRILRDTSLTEIDRKMRELGGYKNSLNIDRWEFRDAKHPYDRIELLAKATEVPIGFYFYNNVDIELKDLKVRIYIHETKELVEFDFIKPSV